MTKKELEGSGIDGSNDDAIGDEAEISADLAAFSEALTAALHPTDIDPDAHEALLARALGLDAAPAEHPADDAEKRRSALLAAMLEGRAPSDDDADPALARLAQLARALRLAYAPTALDELSNQRLLTAGLKTPSRVAARRTVAVAVFALVAAAAAVVGLYVKRPNVDPSTAMRTTPHTPLIEARSSFDLFDATKPFEREKGTTERVDKITTTRASELRDNQFNAWGVQ